MVKKLFALASVTALAGMVSAVGAAGCSETVTEVQPSDAGSDVKPDTKKDSGPPDDGDDGDEEEIPPSKTTGKECSTTTDCEVEGTENGNICSKGAFGSKGGNDVFGTPVCIGACTPNENPTQVADLLCDGETGVCLGDSGNGLCYPACQYDSTSVAAGCAGNNKCAAAYFLNKTDGTGAAILGICYGACTADADCKGSAGQKCQVELGVCVKEAEYKTFAKAVGDGCNGAASEQECNCATVRGEGKDKDKGYCTSTCITGAAGDAACGALKTGWKCSAGLPKEDDDGNPMFSAQPDDVLGVCAKSCEDDADCEDLATAAGVAGAAKGDGKAVCTEFANGHFCNLIEVE